VIPLLLSGYGYLTVTIIAFYIAIPLLILYGIYLVFRDMVRKTVREELQRFQKGQEHSVEETN